MILPDDSIGITDIRSWRECGRRMHFGMRRHTEEGEHPEAKSPSTAYGSAFHDAVDYQARHDSSLEDACQVAFDLHGQWLDPAHLERMKVDLETYLERDHVGVRTVGVEVEVKIPLLIHNGRQIYFRGKIDRLYQSLVDPRLFIHVDYKTSAHPRSAADVHEDIQMWAYNWAIHEVYPECERLVQEYDQLSFGVLTTGKNDEQRDQIRDWIIAEATAILNDEDYGEDGLLQPKINDWCGYCALAESCTVVAQATDFAKARIDALTPTRKEGRKEVIDLEIERVDEYVAQLEEVRLSLKILGRFEDGVKAMLKDMPEARRTDYGYKVQSRNVDVMP